MFGNGTLLYLDASGNQIPQYIEEHHLVKCVIDGARPDFGSARRKKISDGFDLVIQNCLSAKLDQRFLAEELLQHLTALTANDSTIDGDS